MKRLLNYSSRRASLVAWLTLASAGLGLLLLYKLGSLAGGLSGGELAAASAPVGWHGIYQQPFDLPLKAVRSVVFYVFPEHGQFLTRLPNTLFGALAIISFTWLVRQWHGVRTAVFAGLLFACGAWVLHVGRLASFDALYLWATPTLLLINSNLKKHGDRAIVWYGSLAAWGLMLYVPGLIWLVTLAVWLQRKQLLKSWRHFSVWWQRSLYVLAGLAWLPLLIINLTRPGNLLLWLGLPADFANLATLLKQLAAVPVHLFIRGPQYPDVWLVQTPILDIFTLAACIIGIYFYATRWKAGRSKLLAGFALIGTVLVGLGGPVGLSLLVPLLYVAAATGIAYLLREWMRVFPNNPLARSLGLGLVALAVVLSCAYNLRAYFVAWPHTQATKTTFQRHL